MPILMVVSVHGMSIIKRIEKIMQLIFSDDYEKAKRKATKATNSSEDIHDVNMATTDTEGRRRYME